MDFELFLGFNVSHTKLAEVIEETMVEILKQKASLHINEDEIMLGTECFSLAIEIEDISDINFVRNHYDLEVSICIRVQLYGKTSKKGLEALFIIMGNLMKQFEGNLLLLENGSAQLLRKENGKLFVNNDLDQYQIKYFNADIISLLDHSYTEKKLKK
ncbi:hypothetical protein JJQ72_18740 [Paenibacillus sp. F411]|uniref:hypothetical protein n=1 Tax=Paenibacillus sp. F411 TaxID=2820239 RepID=UPI001AAEB0E2|nr:hypothetical protein [Paenibacillus sp. F411]MBO2946020.1 hypothetical protein [Paenibacillus sp. F411]